jgi:large subunit ribosomal protein L15
MKLHELSPAPGSRTKRTRVGRGIAAGGGKTAGRGTKGQKARAGGSIPAWFEGGQTPLHMRIPKLRGFRNPFKIDYEIVNLGRIAALVELGALEPGELPGSKKPVSAAPITVNQEILRAVGAVRTLDKPLKVLGHGEIDTALFVVADAFSRSAVAKIEAAGGSVQVLEVPTSPLAALGVGGAEGEAPASGTKATPKAKTTAKTAAKPTAKAPRKATAKALAAEADEPSGEVEVADATGADATDAAPAAPARAQKGRSTARSKAAAAEPEAAEPEAAESTEPAASESAGEPAETTEAPTGEDA